MHHVWCRGWMRTLRSVGWKKHSTTACGIQNGKNLPVKPSFESRCRSPWARKVVWEQLHILKEHTHPPYSTMPDGRQCTNPLVGYWTEAEDLILNLRTSLYSVTDGKALHGLVTNAETWLRNMNTKNMSSVFKGKSNWIQVHLSTQGA